MQKRHTSVLAYAFLIASCRCKHAIKLCPTETTCGDISSQHDGALVLLELSQHPVPLLLTLVPMNGQSWPPIHPQLPSDLQCSMKKLWDQTAGLAGQLVICSPP